MNTASISTMPYLLIVDADAEDRHAIVHHRHQQRSDHCARGFSNPARSRNPASTPMIWDVDFKQGMLNRSGMKPVL